MRILLDTSYVYDLMETRGQFSDGERRFFAAQEAQLYVSAVSIWEMRLKYRTRNPSGDRKSPFDPNDVVTMVEGQEMIILPMTMQRAARAQAQNPDCPQGPVRRDSSRAGSGRRVEAAHHGPAAHGAPARHHGMTDS